MTKPNNYYFILTAFLVASLVSSCNSNSQGGDKNANDNNKKSSTGSNTNNKTAVKNNFKEGADFFVFERVRLLDKTGFTEPAIALSLLLPKGWTYDGDVVWNQQGSFCSGTFKWIKAKSADGKYSFEMLPDQVFNWNTNQQSMQYNLSQQTKSSYCSFQQPMNADQYLQYVFGPYELGNPQIIKTSPNQPVIQQMQRTNQIMANEAMQRGVSGIQFYQSAINADVRWQGDTQGWVVLGSTIVETSVPNVYNGSVDKLYTTAITSRFVFKYPPGEAEQGKNIFSIIMGSFRSNPWWVSTVDQFWKNARQQSYNISVGNIAIMDAQTRAIGKAAIAKGNERLQAMDIEMRNWEATQSSNDRMHTNFIKTIREVENFRDETGKYEMVSGYDHAWSRGDGNSFILSNNPNFDPSSVFIDQRWKEMKKVND